MVDGKNARGLLIADDTLELRSADSNVTLHPGYVPGGSTLPALEAFANGDVNVRGDLTVIGGVGAPSASVSTLSLGGVDVRTDLDSRALAVDVLLKANSSDVYLRSQLYTQTETDSLLGAKANSLDVYTITQLDGFLAAKANSANVYDRAVLYQKTQVDAFLAAKQDTLSFYDDAFQLEYSLLKPSSSTVRALAAGSNASVTPSASGDALYVDVASTLNVSTVSATGNLTCGGSLGIGTSSPANILDVVGTTLNPAMSITNTSGGYASMYFGNGVETGQFYIGGGLTIATNTAHPITIVTDRFNNANGASLYIDTSNNATFGGPVSGVSFTSTSDASIKEGAEVVSPGECRALFDAIDVKRYYRTDLQQRRVGFIAQDVEAVATGDFACLLGSRPKELPDTSTGGTDAEQKPAAPAELLLTLDYARLTTVLWGVVKELSARVAQLELAAP